MFHTDLSELFLSETLVDNSTVPVYGKDEAHTAFMVSAEGDNVISVQKARRVVLPGTEYQGTTEYIEAAVRDRVACLLTGQYLSGLDTGASTPTMRSEDALRHMKVQLRDHGGLAAIVGNRAVLEALDNVSDVPLYLSPLRLPDAVAFGLPPASEAGRIARRPPQVWSRNDVTCLIGLISFGYAMPVQIIGVNDHPDENVPEGPRPVRYAPLLKTA